MYNERVLKPRNQKYNSFRDISIYQEQKSIYRDLKAEMQVNNRTIHNCILPSTGSVGE